MAIVMASQEQEQLEEEEEDNDDGEMNDQVNAARGSENIAELQRQLLNQAVADADQQMRMYQEASDSSSTK
jgi:hypothetical protein